MLHLERETQATRMTLRHPLRARYVAQLIVIAAVVAATQPTRGADMGAYRRHFAAYARPSALPFPDDNAYSAVRFELGKNVFGGDSERWRWF
jgi:hypothetical protein